MVTHLWLRRIFFPLCFTTLFLTPRPPPCFFSPFMILSTCRLTGLCLLTHYSSFTIHRSTTEKLTEFSSWLSSQMIDRARHADISLERARPTCLLSMHTFSRYQGQQPGAVFPSWIPPSLNLNSLLFLQPRLWDTLSSILLIQGCENEERERICE